MIRFLDFQETLALACATAGPFYVYGEQEAPVLIAGLREKKKMRAVLFETSLELDACTLALSYDIPVIFPASLEELYRMLINAPAAAVLYVCREVVGMMEAYETSGYLGPGELRLIPKLISDAVGAGDVERALDIYGDMEAAYESGRNGRHPTEITYRRGRLMRLYKKGNAAVCVVVLGYMASMVYYLLSESKSIDVVVISGFSRRVLRELKLLSGGYGQIIWVSITDTICSDMICDKPIKKIITREIDELHERLLAALPKQLRRELHYPGRPEEWPTRYLPDIGFTEHRMCPGCIYRGQNIAAAYCEKLGIDVYRSESCKSMGLRRMNRPDAAETTGDVNAADSVKIRAPVIGRPDESCIRTQDRLYAVKHFACDGCGICMSECGCPAIGLHGLEAFIDPLMCTGCGECGNICPRDALYSY